MFWLYNKAECIIIFGRHKSEGGRNNVSIRSKLIRVLIVGIWIRLRKPYGLE